MNEIKFILIPLFFLISITPSSSPENCITLIDDIYITSDTTLCSGIYNVPDINLDGILIVNLSNVIIDCNNAQLIGKNNLGYGIYSNGYNNITIKNCVFENYTAGILFYSSSDNLIQNNIANYNQYGILIQTGFNNNLLNNTACNNSDYDFYFPEISGSSGSNNKCSLIYGGWNDLNHSGCSYTCNGTITATTTTTSTTSTTITTTSTTIPTNITPIFAFGGRGSDNGKFDEPHGISVSSNGTIYVLDTLNNRIQVFDANGTFIEKFGGYDKDGIELGKFEEPEGSSLMEFSENITKIYVTDTRNHRVEIRTSNTTFSTSMNSTVTNISWVAFGERCYLDVCDSKTTIYLEEPTGISVDSHGNIYIADTENNEIKVLNSENKLIHKFNGINTTDGKFKLPKGVAIDNDNYIYVVDTGNNKIRIFIPNGSQIRSFGGYGSGDGRFDSPSAIALDKQDNIYVADTGNSRIQIFDSLGNYITKSGTENCTTKIYTNPANYTGQFCHPAGIAVDSSRIYVSDTENYRIQVFSKPALQVSKREFIISLRFGWNLISIPVEP